MPDYARRSALLALACAMCSSVAAPAVVIDPPEPGQPQRRAARLGYLAQLNAALAAMAADAQGNLRGEARSGGSVTLLERLGFLQSYVGDVDAAMQTFDARYNGARLPKLAAIDNAVLESLRAEAAIAAIVREARTRRVVIINEAHHVPLHRAFTMQLARELRKIGFDYFAAETLSRDGVGMPGRPVNRGDGAYLREPGYAELIRDVGGDGWTVVAYESTELPANASSPVDIAQHRESAQAGKLVRKVLKAHPTARLLVHVGYGHGDKRSSTDVGIRFMGAMLRELGELEPLSIDQTSLHSHPDPAMEWRPYRGLIEARDIRVPSVLWTPAGTPFLLGVPVGAYDLQIVHPPYATVHGRPQWLMSLAGRTPMDIPMELIPTEKPRLIYAFHQEEQHLDALPVDTVLILPNRAPSKLMLPPGHFRLEFED